MKTKIILVISLILGLTPMKAQNIVTGTVTDKKGYPVAGAKVENPKTKQSVLTDPDGTFSMTVDEMPEKLKVRYLGMDEKTVEATPNMNIELKEKTDWHFIVSAGGGVSRLTNSSFKPQFAWKIAFGATKGFLGNFYFMPSLMFSNTNSKVKKSNVVPNYDNMLYSIEYSDEVWKHYNIQLALLVGRDIPINGISIRPKIGPYVGYICGQDLSGSLNRFAVGGIFGFDFDFKNLVIGCDYQISFNQTIRSENAHTLAVYGTIGYKF